MTATATVTPAPRAPRATVSPTSRRPPAPPRRPSPPVWLRPDPSEAELLSTCRRRPARTMPRGVVLGRVNEVMTGWGWAAHGVPGSGQSPSVCRWAVRSPDRRRLDRDDMAAPGVRARGDRARPARRGFRDRRGDATGRARGPSSSVSYTHLRAHETDSYLVCRLLL